MSGRKCPILAWAAKSNKKLGRKCPKMALKKWAANVRDANVGPQKSRRKCPILAGAANVRAANVRAANVRDANVGHTKPTIKCDEQENFCSAPSCSSSSAHVHVQNRGQWPAEVLAKFLADCSVLGDFVSEEEETQLLDEVWPHMKRMRWEDEHWDGQIQRYREREQMLENWLPENQALIRRIWHTSFPAPFEPSPYVHILDLHQDGLISPHLDKSRYCGRVISGLSLLSASVMRMRHKSAELGQLCVADLLLSRRSLYRLRCTFWHFNTRKNF
ncbi:hypothetical protein niasHT_006559 [Heterodera trifolii]|uniref:Alpha-ketoglutarate-dependent dioxygenase AlkB-like domain-containing protein n=1 Tax=Heterodera trifolii TaxID=157864 RepID=A0ABD2LVT0_9BILA